MFAAVGTKMPVWGITRVDPGYLYIVKDRDRYKIGKTKKTKERLRAAKTWLPDMELIALKPFWGISHHERLLHTAFATYWYAGEWFSFESDDAARDLLLEGFCDFTDDNPDRNSVDFIYWYNGEGMVEFQLALSEEGISLRKFHQQESRNKKS